MHLGRSLVLIATLLVTACAAQAPANAIRTLGMADSGKRVTVPLGDFVTIAVPVEARPGGWLIERVDPDVLGQRGEAQPGPEGSKTMLFEFVAKRRGTTDVALVYRRSADAPSAAPARTFNATIVVR